MPEDYNVGDILDRLIALKDAVNEPAEEYGLLAQLFNEPPVLAGLSAAGFAAPVAGAPVEAVAANKIFTVSGTPNNGGTVTIGDVVYTYKTALTGTPDAGDVWVLIDETNNSATNLYKAITDAGTEDTHYKYGEGAGAHALVTATNSVAGQVLVTAKTKGVIGNAINLAEVCDNGAWAGTAVLLSGGVDGTVGIAGAIRYTANVVYFAATACTTADSSGWRKLYLENTALKVIDLSDADADYTVLPTDGIIVVSTTDETPGKILLPAATGSLRKLTVSVQAATNAIVIDASGSETINTATTLSVTALSTVVLLDYAVGMWLTL